MDLAVDVCHRVALEAKARDRRWPTVFGYFVPVLRRAETPEPAYDPDAERRAEEEYRAFLKKQAEDERAGRPDAR